MMSARGLHAVFLSQTVSTEQGQKGLIVRTLIKALLRKASFRNRLWIEQATPPAELQSLIGRLCPHDNSNGMVRIGPAGDGGYLLPDDFEGVVALVSPGVSTECRFDREIADRGIDVHMLDASVDGPNVDHPKFHFEKKFVGHLNDDQWVTMEDVCAQIAGRDGDELVLQMDIEGAEYSVIHSMSSQLLKRFRIMVIEFHDLNQLFSKYSFQFIKVAFDKLLENHQIVHIHPNNCKPIIKAGGIEIPPVMEFTFYRKDRASFSPRSSQDFPHKLDADCVAENPTVVLPMGWRFPAER
jgi:Methyltransferase FkbM domain